MAHADPRLLLAAQLPLQRRFGEPRPAPSLAGLERCRQQLGSAAPAGNERAAAHRHSLDPGWPPPGIRCVMGRAARGIGPSMTLVRRALRACSLDGLERSAAMGRLLRRVGRRNGFYP